MAKKFLLFSFLAVFCFSTNITLAKTNLKKNAVPLPVQTSLVIDSKTGKILHEKNARVKIYPASLTKLMTLYLAFEALKNNKISMNKNLFISKNAEHKKPSKLGVKAGERINVREAIHGMIIRSGNDVAAVMAENLAGSEERFAKIMTIRAHQLGMKDTKFYNPSGWHHEQQKTTAVDLAKLSIALKRDFPQYYQLFSVHSFEYNGKIYNSHNRVARNYEGAEGLKTGFHIPAGYNLATTASRGNISLVAIITGRRSAATRDADMVKLLDNHFNVNNKNAMLFKTKQKPVKPKKKSKNIRLVMN